MLVNFHLIIGWVICGSLDGGVGVIKDIRHFTTSCHTKDVEGKPSIKTAKLLL